MKNKPGINIVHGKIPAMICTSFLNSIRACINAFHRLLTLCTTKAIKYFNRGKAFLSTSKGYKWFCWPNNIHYFGGKAHNMVS